MKGFEIKFKGNTYNIALAGDSVISIRINKRDDDFFIGAGGMTFPDEQSYEMLRSGLELGDEIEIEIKEIEKASDAIEVFDFKSLRESPPKLTGEQMRKHEQWQIERFYLLEKILKSEGLINN